MKRLFTAAIGALAAGALWNAAPVRSASTTAADFSFQSIDGKPMPLAEFRGKVLLVVNTASFCGFTPQYKGLQQLYDTYSSRGLVVIGVPSGDFGGQEHKTEAEVKSFCEGAFGITFPLTAKYHVTGADRHPFYKWAAGELGALNGPWWNFHKYLVGRDGKLVSSFGSRTEPQDAKMINAIEAELQKSAPTASLAP